MLGVEADRQGAEPALQRLAGAAADHVDLGERPGRELLQEQDQLVVGLGEVRRGRERDERAVVVEQQEEARGRLEPSRQGPHRVQ